MHSSSREPTIGMPGGWRPSGLSSQFVCDVAGFGATERGDVARARVRQALYAGLRTAFDAEGCPLETCYLEDRGDGVMIVVPPQIDTALLITSVAFRLRAEVRRHNEFAAGTVQMRLRVAVNTGPVDFDGQGVVGKALNDAFRILDAKPFKDVLADSGADLALIVTQRVYEDVVRQGRGLLDHNDYRPVEIKVKELQGTAWVTLPGVGAPAARDASVVPTSAGLGGFGDLRYKGRSVPHEVLFELVDQALEIPLLANERERERVVSALPVRIAGVIPRTYMARTDTLEIIRTCLDYPGGLQALLVALHGLGGESLPFLEFKRAIVRLLFEAE